MWNPSSQKLMNVEEDDAGRLRKFRERFGRGFDAEAKEVIVEDEVGILFALFQDFEGRVWGEMIY
jgi:predicted secreted protein